MADVTISSLPLGTPSGNLIVPISDGNNTYRAPLSDVQVNYNSIVNKPALATVATTGDYNDLINKPNLPVFSTAQTAGATTKEFPFTGIPSWVKRFSVVYSELKSSGSSTFLIQLGTSLGYVTTTADYKGGVTATWSNGAGGARFNSNPGGFKLMSDDNASTRINYGTATFYNITGNTWSGSGTLGRTDGSTAGGAYFGGLITLTGVLDRVRITTVNGTDNFTTGTVNIAYEV